MFENLKPMYQEAELQKRIKEVAEEIDKDYIGKEIVVVCVLKGFSKGWSVRCLRGLPMQDVTKEWRTSPCISAERQRCLQLPHCLDIIYCYSAANIQKNM